MDHFNFPLTGPSPLTLQDPISNWAFRVSSSATSSSSLLNEREDEGQNLDFHFFGNFYRSSIWVSDQDEFKGKTVISKKTMSMRNPLLVMQMALTVEEEEDMEEDESEDDEQNEKKEDESEGDEQNEERNNNELEELEKEYKELRQKEQDLLKNLTRHKEEDLLKGQAVKNQRVLWDKSLAFRFLLQKPFSSSNRLPQGPLRSSFCDLDKDVSVAYSDLVTSCQKTLDTLLELQKALVEKNPAISQATEGNSRPSAKNPQASKGLDEEADEEWSQISQMQLRIAPFRDKSVDKWQRKTLVTTGAAALKGKSHAFNQDANADGDPELLDDSEFYQQLLKEFLETFDPTSSEMALYAMKKLRTKKRKIVDCRASKSRKIRYNVHEKIVNFMAPQPMRLPSMAPALFDNLFGFRNQKPACAI